MLSKLSAEQLDIIASDIEVRHGIVDRSIPIGTKQFKKMLCNAISEMYKTKGESLFRLTFWMRLAGFAKKKSLLWIIAKAQYRRYSKKFQVRISCLNIGKGLHIVHDTNCYINAEKIGDFFTIYQSNNWF